MMNVSDYLRNKAYSVLGLRNAFSPVESEKFTFVNDLEGIANHDFEEYNAWYSGSADALLQFFNYNDLITYQKEPFYYKNKRSYYWAVASEEDGIKRTHSGIPRAVVDTLVSIVGTPVVSFMHAGEDADDMHACILNDYLRKSGFWREYRQRQMPLTMVDGWGAWKISWNTALDPNPTFSYYRADRVRVYRVSGVLVGMTFLDWYTDGKNRYLVAETRVRHGAGYDYTYDFFKTQNIKGDSGLVVCEQKDIPMIGNVEDITGMPSLFAVPCSFFHDNFTYREGKSLFQGKTDLFDDLDQTLSQMSNTIRRSTPIEQFNLDFCERRQNGRPVMPNTYERKYIGIKGGASALTGGHASTPPVTVTQPQVNAEMYRSAFESTLMACIIGYMAPSYVGISTAVGRAESADSKRESNKTTVLFRNGICETESEILRELFTEWLLAKEYIENKTFTPETYDLSVKFDQFSDVAWEVKLDAVTRGLAGGVLSPEMAVEMLYGNSLPDSEKKREMEYIKSTIDQQAQTAQMQAMIGPDASQMMGEEPMMEEGMEDEPIG